MVPNFKFCFTFLTALLLLCCLHNTQQQDLDQVIEKLAQKVAESQIVKHSELNPVIQQIGVYPCNIRMNFNGNPAAKPARDFLAMFDNNAFVTLWVSTILLETAQFPSAPKPSDEQLKLAIEAVATYHDKNRKKEDGVLVFWPQTRNISTGRYFCDPQNLGPIANGLDDLLVDIKKLLTDLGLEKYWDEIFKSIYDLVDNTLPAFHIPADFDDTFVNLGFGAMLSDYNASSDLYPMWRASNQDNTEVMNSLKKYSYTPFSSNNTKNFIDTRTFFYLRDFLYDAESKSSEGSFATTWVQNIDEDKVTDYDYAMPFHANNVDLTVSTNVLYGISSTVLSLTNTSNVKTSDWFDSDSQIIYENTTNLIAWHINRNFSSRPDLALTYYPSVYNFYWFTARSVNLLQSYSAKHGSFPYAVMERVTKTLTEAMRGSATNDILNKVKTDKDGLMYLDDFLGDNDRNILDKLEESAEDRICSTAVAVNALFYTWSVNQKLLPTTPPQVITVLKNASQWLLKHTLSGQYKPYNVIFSGSVKTVDDLPFFYPSKDLKYLNGSSVPPYGDNGQVMVGVHGVISQQEYQELLKKKFLRRYTPIDFHGYNVESAWPFWSSEPFTYASSLLALTQYRSLLDN